MFRFVELRVYYKANGLITCSFGVVRMTTWKMLVISAIETNSNNVWHFEFLKLEMLRVF